MERQVRLGPGLDGLWSPATAKAIFRVTVFARR
jgi:hypothetical protein